MRIQSVQNQQLQNRPSFAAYGTMTSDVPNLCKNLPGVIDGFIGDDSIAVKTVLQRLSDALVNIFRVDGAKTYRNGEDAYNNVGRFKFSNEDALVLVKEDDGIERPVGIIIHHNDGNRTAVFRNDLMFDSEIDETDHMFDSVAQALDKK